MLCFLAGEVTNAGTFFTTFARVSKNRPKMEKYPHSIDYYHREPASSFGKAENCKWKPWKYEERVEFAKKVEVFKKKDAASKLSKVPKTVAGRLLEYISKVLQCRQMEVPLIGPCVDLCHFEPLHGKNNVIKVNYS